jgi:hypothetical protein
MIRDCLVVALALGALVTAAGCMKTSATYCANHGADDPANCPPVDAAEGTCTSSTDCVGMPGSLVCNTGTGSCVECNAATQQTSACGGAKPVCGDDDACRGCSSHTECESAACLPDGRCGVAADIAYVDGTPGVGMGTTCTQTAPCAKVADALLVTPARSYIMIAGTLVESIRINDRDVTLLGAAGAQIVNTANDTTLLQVTGTSDVAVHDLQIGDGLARTFGVELDTGPTGSLLLHRVRITNNFHGAILALGGQLSVQRSTIFDNIKGGIVVRPSAGKFDIRNNFIYANGSGTGGNATLHGGVLIENNVAGKLEFNTVAFNASTGTQNRGGIACYGLSNSANGNLVYGNRDGNLGPETATQIGGDCPRGTSYALGIGDLGFRNPSTSTPDFHLTAASPATIVDAGGTCQSSNSDDIDGEPRASGAACDVGADELYP